MATTGASTAGHRREKCDFARACNPRIGAYVALIDRATDHVRIFECIGIALTLVGEPRHQIADRRDAIGRIDIFFGLADALTHPGEITNLHKSSCVRTTLRNRTLSARAKSSAISSP